MRKLLHFFSVAFLFFFSSVKAFAVPYSPLTTTGSNYDIVYHRIEISVDPGTSAKITLGKVTTYFKTKVANLTSIEFDLDGAMTVSSATYHGTSIAKIHNTTSDVLTLTIPTIPIVGTLDSVTVIYSGTPIIAPATGVPSGYNYVTHGSSGEKSIFTLDEPYTAHNWWPCKESLDDKIEEVEFIVTAPSKYKVAGNGLVTEVSSGTNTITTWKTKYPIATYAINFAVANYQNYQYAINVGSKNLPVMNYFYSEDNNATYKGYADELKKIIPMFSSLFGVDYPYLDEKYGLAECGSGWGALEVPTMTFVARDAYNKYTLAHEAAHQWFGDMVTTSDWHHIWMNEGFAQYCESVLFPENLYPSELATRRSNLKSAVSTASTTYVSDISTPNKIFIGSGTTYQPYDKGAMVLSMLRTWIGDAKFFSALKDYMTAPGIKYGFTSVDLLRQYMQPKTPLDLTEFFNDWVFQKGQVTYKVNYQYVTKGVYIQLTQSSTSAGVGHFDTPVPIQIKGPGLDTTVVIIDKGGILYNSATGRSFGGNTIYYSLSATPNVAPVFDPNDLVLATAASNAIKSSNSLNTLIVLPIHEIKLDVTSNVNQVRIDWSINADESLRAITIERSTNGTSFTAIQEVTPILSEQDLYKGTVADNLISQTQYYRLKIVKQDGSVLYSKVEKVTEKPVGRMMVAPNPVDDYLNVFLPKDFNEGKLQVIIQDQIGRVLRTEQINAAGKVKVVLPTQALHAGMYWIGLTNEKNQCLRAQFIKH